MDEILQWIGTHWVEWFFCLFGIGLSFFAKHYVKSQKELQEKKWQEKEKNMCGKIISTLDEKISGVEQQSTQKDNELKQELSDIKTELQNKDSVIHTELNDIRTDMTRIQSGILSIQGKQFIELCEYLLEQDYISIEEYEDFEAEYDVYKSLGGNHRGDALHERVVRKCDKQNNKRDDN